MKAEVSMCYGLSLRTQENKNTAIQLIPVNKKALKHFLKDCPEYQAWIDHHQFAHKCHSVLTLPATTGVISQVLVGIEGFDPYFALASAAERLSPHTYELDDRYDLISLEQAALGWSLACYRFSYFKPIKPTPMLQVDAAILAVVQPLASSIGMVRDWVNMPAEDMNPEALAMTVDEIGLRFKAVTTTVIGEDLLAHHFPMIHAVGRAGHTEPRLIQLVWGNPAHPRLALVGKGVCFDTGGLDLKDAAGMLRMKKDMGGAAHALALSYLIMAYQLPVHLSLYIPAVENNVASNAYRPGDVYVTRKGLTVEIGNTDAEGRLVLSDALTLACEQEPDLLIDFATLTGAARVALGPEIPALFSNQPAIAQEILTISQEIQDLVWPMPLYRPYASGLESKIADLNNVASHGLAGAIIGALFLEKFVDPGIDWCHLDLNAWNTRALPGRPEGGEAQGLRAVFAYLVKRYVK